MAYFLWSLVHVRTVATCLLVLGLFSTVIAGPTYYVDSTNGNDAYSDQQAQNPATPWKTIKRAVDTGGLINITKKGVPLDGYTVVVQPGVYLESVESKRDGLLNAPVVIKAAAPGSVTIQPPTGSPGFFISHDYHVIDGFVVSGAIIGLKLGPHDHGDGPVSGLVARNNVITDCRNNGIQFANALYGVAESNTVSQNGLNGIVYSGNSSQLHANTANGNRQFGIYVRDGIGHQVWENVASENATGNIKIQGTTVPPPGSAPIGQRTFYIDGANGDDARSELQAQKMTTAWKTIKRGLQLAVPGETVAVLPGLYSVNVESMRDGTADAPITLRAVTPGTVTITPPSGSGVYIGHNYNVVDGLVITGATASGFQLGPYKANANPPVTGVAVRNSAVYGNLVGIKFTNAIDSDARHNEIYDNNRDGVWVSGRGVTLFNNLVYRNGQHRTGEFGITLYGGDRHQIINNTVYGNLNGGIRLGATTTIPVFSSVFNNIVANNALGIKEPGGSDYVGRATLNYNDVHGNTTANYDLSNGSGTVKGANSFSLPPVFVDPANGDFRLGRRDTGQASDSPAIDKGSDTAEALGLSGRTAFTDKFPDTGQVDLGYHGTPLVLTQGLTTINQSTLTFDLSYQGVALTANLKPGEESDGIGVGSDFVQVTFGGFHFFVPAAGFQQVGSRWVYSGNGTVSAAILAPQTDGSVTVTLQADGLALQTTLSTSTSIGVQIGDDFASTPITFRGMLQYP